MSIAGKSTTRAFQATGTISAQLLPSSSRSEAGAIWRELEARCGTSALTCSWIWTETWLQHYGDVVPHWFAIAEMESEIVGAVLVTRSVGRRKARLPIRTLHFGTAGEPENDTVFVEFNRLLVLPHRQGNVAASVVRAIRESKISFDEWQFDGFLPEDAEALAEAIPDLALVVEPCCLVDLHALRRAGLTPLEAFSANKRWKIRNNLRHFELCFGPISVQWAETAAEAHTILSELSKLHQARWRKVGKPGVFSSDRFVQFHNDLVKRLLPHRVMLLRVAAGGHVLGCLYGFIEGNTLLFYQWGLAEFENKRLAPGYVAGALAMQAALDRGFDEWNWLAGDVRYKRELSTGERPLVWAGAPASLRSYAINGLVCLNKAIRAQVAARLPHRSGGLCRKS